MAVGDLKSNGTSATWSYLPSDGGLRPRDGRRRPRRDTSTWLLIGGSETIYAEVKGRTKGRPGAGLDSLYGQLLRRMPAKEIGDSSTRFAVVVPTGSEAAALRVPSRVRDLLRIDVYVVSDEGDVEIQIGDTVEPEVEPATPKPKKTKMAPKWKGLPDAERAQYLLEHPTLSDRTWTNEPRLKHEKRDAFIRRILLGGIAKTVELHHPS